MKLPTRDSEFELDDDMIEALSVRYPAIDVREESLKLYWWLMRKPSSRPVNMPRFVENWMKKAKPKTVKLQLVSGKMTPMEIEALGRKLGIPARAGEDYGPYLRRLQLAQEKIA